MSADQTEGLWIVVDRGLVAEPQAHAADAWLVEAALETPRTLFELHTAARERDGAPEAPPELADWRAEVEARTASLRSVPFARRFAHSWILVALDERPERLELLREAVWRTAPGPPGLVLAGADAGEFPEWVDVLSPARSAVLGQQRGAIAQLARAVLATAPPTRVLVSSSGVAELLGAELARHALGLIVSSSGNGRGTTRRAATRAWRERLASWLAGEHGLADPGSATSLLVDGDARAVRAATGHGAVVGLSDAAVAAFLTPQVTTSRLARPSNAGDTTRTAAEAIVERDLEDPSARRTGRRVAYSSLHLLGDSLAATAVLRAHRAGHPDDHITFLVPDTAYARVFELCPGVDCIAYLDLPDDDGIVYASSRERVESLEWWREGDFDERHVLDVQEAARVAGDSMAEIHAASVGLSLDDIRPWIDPERARDHRPPETPDGPFVVLARHTVSGRGVPTYSERTKRWSERRWLTLAERIRRELGLAVVSVGTPGEGRLETPGVLDLHELDIREAAGLLASAAALVTVDNGLFHLGHGLGVPLVHLQPQWLPAAWTGSVDDERFIDLHTRLPTLGVKRVFEAVRALVAAERSAAR